MLIEGGITNKYYKLRFAALTKVFILVQICKVFIGIGTLKWLLNYKHFYKQCQTHPYYHHNIFHYLHLQ